jgi:hypothetical protein
MLRMGTPVVPRGTPSSPTPRWESLGSAGLGAGRIESSLELHVALQLTR